MKEKFTIYNEEGLHMRPSSQIILLTESFCGDVFFHYSGIKVNAKNIMELMFLSLCKDDEFYIEIISSKNDKNEELKLYNQLKELIEKQKFGEY